jgi:hypothetical protein
MKRHVLVVSNVSPSFAFADEELGVKAPCDDRVDDEVAAAVDIDSLWYGEELALTAGYAGSGSFRISKVRQRLAKKKKKKKEKVRSAPF